MSTEEQSKKDLYYMQRALAEAEAAYKEGEIPIGAEICMIPEIKTNLESLEKKLKDELKHGREYI